MRTRQSIALAGIFTIILLLSAFGTEVWGQTYYWWGSDGTSNTLNNNFGTAANWSLNDPTATPPNNTYSGSTVVPGSGATIKFLRDTDAGKSITVAAARSVAGMEVGVDLTMTTTATLTVDGPTTLNTGKLFKLKGAAAISLKLNGAVTFQIGAQMQGLDSHAEVVELLSSATLRNGTTTTGINLLNTYSGDKINFWIKRDVGLLLTDFRFEGPITVDCEWKLGDFNAWLGTKARVVRSDDNNQTQKYVEFTAQESAAGMLIQDVAYWKNGPSNTYTPNDNQPIEFPVGTEKHVAITVDVKFAHEIGELSGVVFDEDVTNGLPQYTGSAAWTATATKPFRGVGIRAVGLEHPANMAQNRYEYYWVVQNIGLFQDWNAYWFIENGDQEIYWNRYSGTTPLTITPINQICIGVEFQPGYIQGSPQNVYASRYTNNNEEFPYPGTTMSWYSDGSSATPTNSSGRVFVSLCPTSGFGDITIASAGDPVPVELTSFSARWFDGAVRLNWQTATEINNFGFAIERSEDGERWTEVGFVPGHGNSSSPKFYEHMDVLEGDALRVPKLAYRLRQMDRDGTTEYSNIVNVHTGELPEGIQLYAAYPNPFNPATTISFAIGTPSNVTLKVYNTLGQAVATLLAGSAMDAGLHTVPFDGATLPSGVYMAVLESDGAVQHQKLVLNK